jgi:hypothetical protein
VNTTRGTNRVLAISTNARKKPSRTKLYTQTAFQTFKPALTASVITFQVNINRRFWVITQADGGNECSSKDALT